MLLLSIQMLGCKYIDENESVETDEHLRSRAIEELNVPLEEDRDLETYTSPLGDISHTRFGKGERGGCGGFSYQPEEAFAEDLIYYASWANGKWQNEEVNICSYLGNYVHESREVVNSFVGEIYDLSEPLRGEVSGGVVPIRDRETQIFFHGDVELSYLELAGNYYAMFWIDIGEGFMWRE